MDCQEKEKRRKKLDQTKVKGVDSYLSANSRFSPCAPVHTAANAVCGIGDAIPSALTEPALVKSDSSSAVSFFFGSSRLRDAFVQAKFDMEEESQEGFA